jgi:hypothetical protein
MSTAKEANSGPGRKARGLDLRGRIGSGSAADNRGVTKTLVRGDTRTSTATKFSVANMPHQAEILSRFVSQLDDSIGQFGVSFLRAIS